MRLKRTALWISLGIPLSLLADSAMPPAAKIHVDFKEHVQPILAAKCYGCHGSKVQQSGLRLDKRQNALRGGDYGPVIVVGNSADSKLIHRVVDGDGGLQMPPSGALEPEQIGILRAWIDQGADFGKVEVKEEVAKPVDPKLKELISLVRGQNLAAVQKALHAAPELIKGQDAGGSTLLHHAAGFGTIEIMKALLDSGAAVDAKNHIGSSPLHWAINDMEKLRLLIDRGADVNSASQDGRTPLYMAASLRESDAVFRFLLEKGADPNRATLNGRTPIMAAAGAGSVEEIKLLLAKKAKADIISGSGSTPLMDAASSGNVEAVRLFLDLGVNVNAQTKLKQTALGLAAMQGSEDIVKLLLDRGAKVNVQDQRGYSPLMYAAYAETMPTGIVRMLLAKGADLLATGEGETAQSLAAKRGDTEIARLLGVAVSQRKSGGVASGEKGSPEDRPIPEAVRTALNQLERQSPTFVKTAGCNSCHNQNLPSAAAAMARERGIKAPKEIEQLPHEMVEKSPERTIDMMGVNVNNLGYEMFDMAANHRPADEYTDAVVHFMKSMQMPEGYWETTANRPPLAADDILTTALAINALKTYTPAMQKADTEKRLARAAAWLASARPVTTQELAFDLLGLVWAQASPAAIERAANRLTHAQRTDGGWAQLPTMGTDAYASGQALYALGVAGKLAANNPVYQKGIKYLLRTQAPDGTWHVKTRSLPIQPYFQSGLPYEHDQWISAAGTSWASMALTLATEPERVSRR
jgi:ankyrin repeat protein